MFTVFRVLEPLCRENVKTGEVNESVAGRDETSTPIFSQTHIYGSTIIVAVRVLVFDDGCYRKTYPVVGNRGAPLARAAAPR